MNIKGKYHVTNVKTEKARCTLDWNEYNKKYLSHEKGDQNIKFVKFVKPICRNFPGRRVKR